jgi:hypothetical protein
MEAEMKRVAVFATVVTVLLSAIVIAQTPAKPLSKYDIIVVEKFGVGSLAANSGYPTGFDGILQKTVVAKLASSKVFKDVADGADTPQTAPLPEMKGRLLLSGTVIGYDKGSRTARWMVGMGAGKSSVKVRFICKDAATSEEVWRTDQEGTFAGTLEIGGGNEQKALNESSLKVAERLVKQIRLVR